MSATIGVFDSGIGGLSILKALRDQMPWQRFVYIADSAHAPYGERDVVHVLQRSRAITAYLRLKHQVQLVVVACNTATALAIDLLRAENPNLSFVGVEPALKPAAALTLTGRVGVMATRSTLASARFQVLLNAVSTQASNQLATAGPTIQPGKIKFICQPCDGLASAIEETVHTSNTTDLIAFCAHYTGAMGLFGIKSGQIDTLVLGCTHYPFAEVHLRRLLGPDVAFVSTGEPVARQTLRRLQDVQNYAQTGTGDNAGGHIAMAATGAAQHLKAAAEQWLGWRGDVELLSI